VGDKTEVFGGGGGQEKASMAIGARLVTAQEWFNRRKKKKRKTLQARTAKSEAVVQTQEGRHPGLNKIDVYYGRTEKTRRKGTYERWGKSA